MEDGIEELKAVLLTAEERRQNVYHVGWNVSQKEVNCIFFKYYELTLVS